MLVGNSTGLRAAAVMAGVTLTVLFMAPPSFSADDEPAPPPVLQAPGDSTSPVEIPPPAESGGQAETKDEYVIDKGHAGASERVRRLGAWVDQFFADENYEAEANTSLLRIRLDSFSELYEGTEPDAKVRLHLSLPNLSKRIRFEILSPSEPDDLEGNSGEASSQPQPGAAEEKTSAAISYFVRALKDRSFIVRLGTTFDGYTPNPYVGARYRRLRPVSDKWNLNFVQRLRFYSIDGLESRTSFDFERALEENSLFRTSLNGTWLQEDPNYFYDFGFALFRPLDEKSAVEYQLTNGFKTDPHRLDRITVRIRHRQKLWRDWLTFEMAPQVSFPRERDYEPVPGILFRLEASFGG